MSRLVEVRDVSVVFSRRGDAVHALQNVDFVANTGEAVGVVGESGSGKSTLARVLSGLQPPTSGTVRIGAHAAVGSTADCITQIVFQDPYSALNPRLTALSAVSEAVHVWRRVDRRESRRQALALLADMGISPEQAHLLPAFLSGGQRQRVSMARALAPEPQILIADEPTSAIDQSAQAQLLNLMRRLQGERGLTIIFISHDLGLVRYFTSRVYVMKGGRVVESGLTREVLSAPKHPYTMELLASVPRRVAIEPPSHAGSDMAAGPKPDDPRKGLFARPLNDKGGE